MSTRHVLAVAAAAVAMLGVAACQYTTDERSTITRTEEIEELIAARQGPEVDRVCFTNNINSWNALGRDAVLIRRGVRDWYKLDLSGTCQPEWAFDAIAIRSRPAGTSCLSRGDRVTTDDRAARGVCFVNAIYEWNDDAPIASPRPVQTSANLR